MTQRRGGRPTGPARVPFTTTIRPEARAELSRRAVESFGTERAANRVIEEAMGFAVAKETVSVPATIYVDRSHPDGELEVSAVVVFELERDGSAGDWRIGSALAGGDAVVLTIEEADKACEIAHEKFCANPDAYR